VKSASATFLALFLCLWGCGKKSEQPPAEAANPIDPNSGESNSGADGTVYVGSAIKKIFALNSTTGAKKWEFETEGWIHLPAYSPGIGADGTVYVGSGAGGFQNNKLHALDGMVSCT